MQKLWRASWIWDLVLSKLVGLCTVGSHCSILHSDELALIPLYSAMSQRRCTIKALTALTLSVQGRSPPCHSLGMTSQGHSALKV